MSRLVKVISLVIIFSLFMVNIAYAGIGLSPASISFYNMTRGGYAEKYLTVSNPGNELISVVVSAEGEEVGEFLTFQPQKFNLTGESYKIVKVNVTTPNDIPNGIYEGSVYVIGKPIIEFEGGSQLAVASGVSAKATIGVTDIETKEYRVESVRVFETEECREIQVQTSMRNSGNVRVTPEINVKIISKDESQVLQNYDYTADTMLPTTVESFMMRIPYKLEQFKCIPVGEYRVVVSYYVDGRQFDLRYLRLVIHERGALTVSGELLDMLTSPNITLGDVLKIDGIFKNTGQLPVKSKLTVDVYEGSRLIDTTEGEEKEVGIGGVTNLTAYYRPESAGKFLLKGEVWFEGKVSNQREIEVDVFLPMIFMVGIAVAAIIAVVVIIFFLRRRMAKPKRGRRRR